MEDKEQIFLINSVGTISNRWIKVKTAMGGRMTIQFENIQSIEYRLRRKYLTAIVWLGIGISLFIFGFTDPILAVKGLFMVFILIIGGLANLLGYYEIYVQTVKKRVRLEDVEFNKLKDGRIFIETLEKLIASKSEAV